MFPLAMRKVARGITAILVQKFVTKAQLIVVMASFDYGDQDPSRFIFLKLMRELAI